MKDKKVLIMAALIVILTIVGIALGVIIYNNKNVPEVKETFTYDIGEMISNLKSTHRIIKCDITTEVTDKELLVKFDKKLSEIKDSITKILRSKKETDIEGTQGQINVQNEIKRELKRIFESEEIVNVFFNEFIVQ